MKTNKKLISIPLASTALILFLILFSSTASAATATCNVKGTNYQYWSGEQYPSIDLFGEKLVPLFEENKQIWESHVDKLAMPVIDSGGNYELKTGENLDLGQGYSLQAKQVDVDGKKVWLEFDKDGQYVDDQIISTDSGDNTWNCTLDIQGINNVVVLKVHVNRITQSATESLVLIDGIWLIDYENVMTFQIGDQFEDYTLKEIVNGTNESNLGSLVFDYMVTITDLGTLGGSESWAYGINDKEQIVGCSYTGTGVRHAFLWQNGVMTDPGISSEHGSCANGINEEGQIVGYCYLEDETPSGGGNHAFLWQNGVMTDIETSELGSFAKGINDKGQVVGYSAYEPDGSDAFLWQNGVITYITYGDLERWTEAWGINENGQVVGCNGSSEDGFANNDGHASLWQNGVMTDLGTLGGPESCANGINDKGQVVGDSETGTGEYHAFLWQNGVMTDLGTLGGRSSCAYGINNKGQVVGESETGTGETHAFLWQNGVMTDLGTLPGGSESCAYEINENGQIVGESETGTGETHATLWTAAQVSEIKVFDNRLREAAPDSVYKSSSFIDIGGMNSVRYRDLMQFDLGEYISDSQISNAVLSLYWYYPAGKTRSEDTVIEIYRPASAWNSDYVSWNKKDNGVAWKNPGGDWYDKNGVFQGNTPYATITIKGSSLPDNKYYELDVTDLVKEYVSGKYENTGILIKARTESSNYIAFYSSDWTNENQKPKITVTEKVPVVTVTGATDNRLREASPDSVYKSSSFIDAGGMNNVRYRDVMRFNLSQYDSGTPIEKAALSLYWYYPAGKTRPNDTVIEVYRPASSWNSDYVSWNKKDKNLAWKNPGGDWYDKNGVLQGSTPYATITIKGSSLPDNRYYKLDVTDLVKEYVSGKYENTGFLIKARMENNNYIAFYSNDCGDENKAPKLQLAYS